MAYTVFTSHNSASPVSHPSEKLEAVFDGKNLKVGNTLEVEPGSRPRY